MKGILLATTLVLASLGAQAKELPSNDEIIANLSKEGYSMDWEELESGGKILKLEDGNFYLNEKGAFALVGVAGNSDDEMVKSFMAGLKKCADIGMAVVGKTSKEVRGAIVDTLLSSTQVSSSVSDMVWGYKYEAIMLPVGEKAMWSCGIYH